jgi:hypothetical protein
MWMRIFGVVLVVVGLLVGAGALMQAMEQDRAVREYVPVRAKVTASSYTRHRSKNSTTYTPDIQYRYTVGDLLEGGHVYLGDRVSVYGESFNSLGAINDFLDHYPVDALVMAYVDPQDGSKAVLVKRYAAEPYWFGWFGLYAALVGVMMTVGLTRTGPKGMRTVPLGEGWELLLPRKNLKKRYRESLVWCVGTLAIAGVVAGHYLMKVRPYGVGGYVLLALVAGWVLWQAVRTWRRRAVSGSVSDARVQLNPVPVRREGPLALRVELDALKPLRVEEATARVVCTEHYQERRGNKTQVGTRVKGETAIPLCGAKQVAPGEMVEGEGTVELDPSWPGTSADQKHYPHYTWSVKVKVKLAGMADYAEEFVVEVV